MGKNFQSTVYLFPHPDEDNDQDVRDRAMLYYRLLKTNLQKAKVVVCGQPKVILEKESVKADKVSRFMDFRWINFHLTLLH